MSQASTRQPLPENAPSVRLYDTLPWTPENMLTIARAMLEDPAVGDVPEIVAHQFAMELTQAQQQQVLPEIARMRAEHFAALGKAVPEYAGNFPR